MHGGAERILKLVHDICRADKLDVELSHMPHSKRSVVERMIEEFKPKRNSPVEMKIVLTDETPVFQHARCIAYTDQKVAD